MACSNTDETDVVALAIPDPFSFDQCKFGGIIISQPTINICNWGERILNPHGFKEGWSSAGCSGGLPNGTFASRRSFCIIGPENRRWCSNVPCHLCNNKSVALLRHLWRFWLCRHNKIFVTKALLYHFLDLCLQ